jgi:hypothetical protein
MPEKNLSTAKRFQEEGLSVGLRIGRTASSDYAHARAGAVCPQLCPTGSVKPKTMRKHIALLVASFTAVSSAFAASYSTEATMTPTKTNSQCEVVVRVSQLVERNGRTKEEVISAPRILTNFGTPGSLYVGLQPGE